MYILFYCFHFHFGHIVNNNNVHNEYIGIFKLLDIFIIAYLTSIQYKAVKLRAVSRYAIFLNVKNSY